MAFTYAPSKDTRFVAKVESVFGTDSTPAGGTDDAQIHDCAPIFDPERNYIKYNPHNASNTLRKDIPGVFVGKGTIRSLFCGSGTPGVPTVNQFSGLAAMLQASGMTMTAVVGTPSTITFTPATRALWKSATVKGSSGGIHRTMTGVYSNVTMEGGPTSPGLDCMFEFQGAYNDSTLTNVSGYTGGAISPAPFLGMAATLTPSGGSGYAFRGSSFKFNRGVALPRILSFNQATGLEQVFPGQPEPTVEIVMAADIDGTANLTLPNMEAHCRSTLTHGLAFTLGSGSGLSCAFAFPQLQPLDMKFTETEEHIIVTASYKVQHSTNDSEFSITIS